MSRSASARGGVRFRAVDRGTLITLGVIGAFVVLIIAGLIARSLLAYPLSRQKRTKF